jgi:chromosome segregation ATPase
MKRGWLGSLEQEQRSGDERFTLAQHRLFGAREAAEDLSQRAAEARATHAGLVERAAALHADVRRLEESAVELEQRADALAGEIDQVRGRIERLREVVSPAKRSSTRTCSHSRGCIATCGRLTTRCRCCAPEPKLTKGW